MNTFYIMKKLCTYTLVRRLTAIAGLLIMCNPGNVTAQQIPTLEDAVYGGLETEYAPYVNWMDDGEHYSVVEGRGNDVSVVAYSAKDNSKETIIPSDMLIDKSTGKNIGVRKFCFNSNNTKVLIYTNTKRVWRYDTKGDYWLLDRNNGTLRRLGKGLESRSLMFAKFSPDGEKVAYVSNNNIYMEHCTSSEQSPEQLTFDGCDSIVNGTFDWVYEEEFDCRDGFSWSADSKYIAYWQSNTSGTGVFDIINNVDSLYPTIQHFPYPKAGTQNSAVRVGVIDIFGESRKQGGIATLELRNAETKWIDIKGNDGVCRDYYLPRMDFVPGTNRLTIQQMNRPQNTNTLWTCEISKGEINDLKVFFNDQDSAWVETNDNIHWLNGNKFFTFTSERDGWRHIYRVSADGKKANVITKGNFDVIEEVGIDEKNGLLYFIASPDNATQRYLYRTNIYGNGKCELVSDAKLKGQHSYNMSPTCKWAVHTFSNARTMPMSDMVEFPQGKSVRQLADNSKQQKEWDANGLNKKEFVKVKSGDLMLDAWMIKPAAFDANKKYPVIIDVYGEPALSTVQDVWSDNLWHQYLANLGYIVVSIDNRGAAAPRGREWRKCIYGEVGTFACQDQAQGILDLARQYDFIDTERIGITGWSGGGSQTLNCMFRYPEVFKTGIAVAFVSDQKLYDTIYQERYMNTPQNNPDGYKKGSPINYVDGLKGNLLLMHGTGDDNVHYQSCEMLVNELVKAGKVFYQISYPMRTHSIHERQGTSMHLRKTMADFWLKYLPAGGK